MFLEKSIKKSFLVSVFLVFVAMLGIFGNAYAATEVYEFDSILCGPGTGDGEVATPVGIAISNSDGSIYVVDSANDRIQKFDSEGIYISQWDINSASNGGWKIAVDANGDNVYISDVISNKIRKFDNTGTFITEWGSSGTGNGEFQQPHGIAVDNKGDVYVADANNHRIQKFTSDGTFLYSWGGTQSGLDGEFDTPEDIAIDSNSGDIYVVNTASTNCKVQKFDSNMQFITKFGQPGLSDGEFSLPEGIAIDNYGDVYVADRQIYWGGWDNRIQKFDSNGNFLQKWGGKGSSDGLFETPYGIAVDSNINVYLSDITTDKIQKFKRSMYYNISGYIVDINTNPIVGATVTFSGSENRTTFTDVTGAYIFTDLIGDQSYDLTAVQDGYMIEDIQSTLASDTTQDFIAYELITISGYIKDTSDNPITDSSMTITVYNESDDSVYLTTTVYITDGNGYYSQGEIPVGLPYYYVFEPIHDNYVFNPSTQTYRSVTSDYTNQDFEGSIPQYDISGTVTDGSQAIEGATVTLVGMMAADGTVLFPEMIFVTGNDGYYEFINISSTRPCYVDAYYNSYDFDPAYHAFDNLTQDMTNQDFIGTPDSAVYYRISGQVKDDAGNGISSSSMVITVIDIASDVVTEHNTEYVTDVNGYFDSGDMSEYETAACTFIISPIDDNYTFEPSSRVYSAISSSYINQDFVGTLVSTGTYVLSSILSVDKTELDFGEIKAGGEETLSFVVSNTGSGDLSGTITSDKSWIELSDTSFASNDQTVNVTITRSNLDEDGYYNGTITIDSNGGTTTIAVSVEATCVLTKPNPYNPRTDGNLIFYGTGIEPLDTEIRILTISGEHVKTLYETSDVDEIPWDGKNEDGDEVVNGIYIYMSKSPKEKWVGKFTVIKK